MLLIRPSTTWLCFLSLLIFFFLFCFLFLLFPKKASASSISWSSANYQKNVYNICSSSDAESQLLDFIMAYVNVDLTGSDSPYILPYWSWASGDNSPYATLVCYNASGQTVSCSDPGVTQRWWKANASQPAWTGSNLYMIFLTGLVNSGPRTVRMFIWNPGANAPASPLRYADTLTPEVLDRTPPNYTPSGDWTFPNWSGSAKLRTTTPGSSSPYDPAGIKGMTVNLQPSTPREDYGGFNYVDRVDLWVAYSSGDDTGVIKSGNPICAPSPPYASDYGDLCKNGGPMNCANFQAGAGKAWYINNVTGISGGSVDWNTNGFASGNRTIVGNAFDHNNRNSQNVMTYSGNSGDQNSTFARVVYNLMPPHAPTANFTSYPPGGIINNAPTNQNISFPATASDSYGYLTRAEMWVAKRDRTQSFTCTTTWSGSWCKIVQSTFSKRSSYPFSPTPGWTPLEGGTYDVFIQAFDQFGEKCTGDPQTPKNSPQWPPLWTNCGFQSWIEVNVKTIDPWIKTVGGDVHSNTTISTSGGP